VATRIQKVAVYGGSGQAGACRFLAGFAGYQEFFVEYLKSEGVIGRDEADAKGLTQADCDVSNRKSVQKNRRRG